MSRAGQTSKRCDAATTRGFCAVGPGIRKGNPRKRLSDFADEGCGVHIPRAGVARGLRQEPAAMKREQTSWPMNPHLMQIPTPEQASSAVRASQALYRKTLMGWASDTLIMRHRGMHEHTWRAGMHV